MPATYLKEYISASAREEMRRARAISNRAAPPPLPRPTLGARVMAVPVLGDVEATPLPGTIDYIHETHYWYRVRFDAGFCQCYQWGDTK